MPEEPLVGEFDHEERGSEPFDGFWLIWWSGSIGVGKPDRGVRRCRYRENENRSKGISKTLFSGKGRSSEVLIRPRRSKKMLIRIIF